MQYYALGTALVTRDELVEKHAVGDFQKLTTALAQQQQDHTLEFSTGELTTKSLLAAAAPAPAAGATGFTPIGPGLPLTIELRHVYTGDEPSASWFQRTKDMIVTSAIKGFTTYKSAPRAVNMLQKSVGPRSDFKNVTATSDGTPLIFYLPAVTEEASTLTIDVMFDNFPDQVFTTVGNAFTSAGGIPIFASANVYLIAAGIITRLLATAGHTLFDGHTGFHVNDTIEFDHPGTTPTTADYRLLTQSAWKQETLAKYHIDNQGALVDEQGASFHGDDPYVVISLDGRRRDQYANFNPTAASAALLDQFFNVKDGLEQSTQVLIDAMKLYNDWTYRSKADKAKAELAALDQSSDEYKKKKAEYDADVKNILTDQLKPGTPS